MKKNNSNNKKTEETRIPPAPPPLHLPVLEHVPPLLIPVDSTFSVDKVLFHKELWLMWLLGCVIWRRSVGL